MGLLQFRQAPGEDIVAIPQELTEGVWADISAVMLAYGAVPSKASLILSPLTLRLAAHDLGELLIRHNIESAYDHPVLELLQSHLRECRARIDAEGDLSVLSRDEVLRFVYDTGRFQRVLTENQLRDLGRLLRLEHGANFSVPGAGKTTTLLACYEASCGQDLVDRLLVVAPKNAFLSWEDEIGLCYLDPTKRPVLERIAGGYVKASETFAKGPEIALITYQFLPNVIDLVKSWVRRGRTHVVLDESHRIKAGPDRVYAFAALQVSPTAARRDILSGTPLPNAPEDLRAQLEFLWPGQRILPEQKLGADDPQRVLDQVQQSVKPLYVRTTKKELDLPPLEPIPIPVTLGALQRELYELLRSEAKRIAAGFSSYDVRVLRRLGAHVMKLLEAASNPMLLASKEGIDLVDEESRSWSQVWELLREVARLERPAKISKVVEIVEHDCGADEGHKILIWTSFVENVFLLEKLLAKYQPVSIYGAIATGSEQDEDTREGRIRRFHTDPSCRLMIANPAACGEGISLHKACHHAIYLDRTFNAAHYLQSIDRIHRLGLSKEVFTRVQILEARWTIDARVAKRLKAKIDSMSLILNDPGLAALAYDPLDVVEEFPAGIQFEDVEEIVEHIVQGDENGA